MSGGSLKNNTGELAALCNTIFMIGGNITTDNYGAQGKIYSNIMKSIRKR